jgi:hypothetical protein
VIRKGAPERRYAILAEGWFANRHAKTAHGLIRYGKDQVVCVIDSTLAGERVRDVLPDLGRDAPIVGTLEEVLEFSPTSILVGLAPAGGRLRSGWRPCGPRRRRGSRLSAASTSVSHPGSPKGTSGTCASHPRVYRSSRGRASR